MAYQCFYDDVAPMDGAGERTPAGDLVSRIRTCDGCGRPLRKGESLHLRGGFEVCDRCVDEGGR